MSVVIGPALVLVSVEETVGDWILFTLYEEFSEGPGSSHPVSAKVESGLITEWRHTRCWSEMPTEIAHWCD